MTALIQAVRSIELIALHSFLTLGEVQALLPDPDPEDALAVETKITETKATRRKERKTILELRSVEMKEEDVDERNLEPWRAAFIAWRAHSNLRVNCQT